MKGIMNLIGTDGKLHIPACYAIVLTTGLFTYWQFGMLAAWVAAIAKEVVDHYRGKHGEDHAHDLACDLMGIGLAIIMCELAKLFRP